MKDKDGLKQDGSYSDGSLPERFDSWVTRILRNLINTEVRSFYREKTRVAEILTDDIEELAQYDPFSVESFDFIVGETPMILENERLAKALQKISHRKQQVIEGTIILGIPTDVVAKKLGVSNQIVRNYKYRGLSELRELMNEEEGEGEYEE